MSDPSGTEPTAQYYISQRLRLHYADWGNPGAPPLILLHGGRDHCRNWDWVAPALRDRYHVIAPDLRGHGDSAWSPDGDYTMAAFVLDLAALIADQALAPLTIIGHSLGGAIATRYAGLYPEQLVKLVAIEGLGLPPAMQQAIFDKPVDERFRQWIDHQRGLAARAPKRYPTLDDALTRMEEENGHLSPHQVRHLTLHGIRRNDDGSWSWKFDNYVRSISPVDISPDDLHSLWARISCPTLLVYGSESWASNPVEDGRAAYFSNARVAMFEKAGHWVHHDRLEAFLAEVAAFLAE
ncbi:MAG TPA: alpha/beta hydrolase [Allosphingosinicella sp.]|nr:alpha/beta hydrolase [Allosphingosinicella sp.]